MSSSQFLRYSSYAWTLFAFIFVFFGSTPFVLFAIGASILNSLAAQVVQKLEEIHSSPIELTLDRTWQEEA